MSSSGATLALGIVLAACGGASLALAMVIQRYALDLRVNDGAAGVRFLGSLLPRNAVWFIGLLMYGLANGFYALALLYGPLSLLAGVFTTLLVWNMLFARLILGEVLTPFKIGGALTILLGVIMAIVAAPVAEDEDDARGGKGGDDDVEDGEDGEDGVLTPSSVRRLVLRPVGLAYLALLLAIVAASVLAIQWFERRYPLMPKTRKKKKKEEEEEEEEEEEGQEVGGQPASSHASRVVPPPPPPVAAVPALRPSDSVSLAPGWLDRAMGVVYPASLGVDEGLAHLTMKASVAMLDSCRTAGECGGGHLAVIIAFVAVWTAASVATLWWLRRVFSRYETTQALPVEYGAVNAVSACSGLVFFREAALMEPWQLATTIAALLAILAGIAIGRLAGGEAEQGDGAGEEEEGGDGSGGEASVVVSLPPAMRPPALGPSGASRAGSRPPNSGSVLLGDAPAESEL